MANLLRRLRGDRSTPVRSDPTLSFDEYLSLVNEFAYGGLGYPLNQTYAGVSIEDPEQTLAGYSGLMKACPPAFAAQMVRAMILSQARFTFRNNRRSRTPGRKFGTSALELLEKPWPNATTGNLISRMEWHAGLQGNAFVVRQAKRLRVLRPDWVTIIYGSKRDPGGAVWETDSELLGYVYRKGGDSGTTQPQLFLPEEVAHWAPVPDPEAPGRGMSWFTPAVREAQVDRTVTEHKLRYFKNGATPNLVVKGLKAPTLEQFKELVEALEGQHAGVRNAYRTLYLSEGADATVVGSNLKDLDLKALQGGAETRIAYLSRVPAPVLSIAEGLQGSALNAGNYGQARRNFADSWVYPTLQDLAACLATITAVPSDADLWHNTDDMPFLREDAKDAAEIEKVKADTIASLIREGFTPDSVVAAVNGQDMNLLTHTGMVSVQLQLPGAQPAAAPPGPPTPPEGE